MTDTCPTCNGTGTVQPKKVLEFDGCSVVTSRLCKDPDPEDPKVRALPECFRCGQPVCRFCSVMRKYLTFGTKRVCDNCEDEIEGNDEKSLARRHHEAGYERCRKSPCKHSSHVTDEYERRWGA